MEDFLINNSISIFGITGTFIILVIGIVGYLSFKLGQKKIPDSYNTDNAQCEKYASSMDEKGFPYQRLQITHCNGKVLSTNCIFWKAKNKCELIEDKKCKFFN
ncbi:MAG: hypothetical protein WC149_05475 [Arcobacteraceae bacterium]